MAPVSARREIADELKRVIRLAGRDYEALEGDLPALSALHRVTAAGPLDPAARVHFILHRLIPDYRERLPAGRDGRAIRELLSWEDADGEVQSLTTRYHKAAAHLVNAASDFGRRQEPRLLLECARRFQEFDHEDRLASIDPPRAPAAPVSGIVAVHPRLDYDLLTDYMGTAQEIVILNTWIPELNILDPALGEALARGARISILMLYPASRAARLRSRALARGSPARSSEDRVEPGVRHCLDMLAAIAREVDDDGRRRLRVGLYDSLPSISVYGVDERAFFSVFLHGRLAVRSAQIEVQGRDSTMGQLVFGELETLWEIAQEFEDITQWQTEIESMSRRFDPSP
jgi:hypothetical protein